MKYKYLALLLVLTFFISCTNTKNDKVIVDFSDTAIKEHSLNDDGSKAVYIAIASMTSPKETYIYYSELINYISDKVGYPIYIKQKKTYDEVNQLLDMTLTQRDDLLARIRAISSVVEAVGVESE